MKLFYFEGEEYSREIKGYVFGKNETDALKRVNKSILIKKFEFVKRIKFKKLSQKEHLTFIKSLKALLATNITFFDAVDLMRKNTGITYQLKVALDFIVNNLIAGNTYVESLRSAYFFDYELRVSLSGVSDEKEMIKMLERLENIYQNRINNYKEFKNIIAYPLLLFSAIISLLFFLQFYISPIFSKTFNVKFNFLFSWGIILLFSIIAIAVAVLLKYRRKFDKTIYKIPFLGNLYMKFYLLEFIENTLIFIESGDTLYSAFEKSSEIATSKKVAEEINEMLLKIKNGKDLSDAFKDSSFGELIYALSLSNDIGNMKKPLEIMETHLNLEIGTYVQKLKKIFEPILISILSVIILEIVYTFYNGMFNAINMFEGI
ncbi:type II secretory pathway, component PulF [Marinitoga piezophila KA3]|uniref:Type II secretory pathway, component PulF n=1 Tax=Marinitoga piezophila (strain DSM 14283 / JCM 11233 / KA3) TaxID=443254 RepID=H2J3F8_MARPK|nr:MULTISPECIES: type II secretion system F family protein [Marinitoga]AEX85774.1 type II secretory pathway, component PulF [Marinitoga piezophila KA3]APT76216.1 hypothetical protein LN42_07340 [Marinitoga sp. 1137]NUU97887.1 hypothetical protein [Marinitoga sp. 1138]